MTNPPRNRQTPTFVLFFLSGFCGLLYQIVWIRLAFSHFGVITPVLSVVISVFMLGLAVGSWAAGRWIESWKTALGLSAIYFYAAAEFIVGLGAFLVPVIYAWGDGRLLPVSTMNSLAYLAGSALVMTIGLLPWCLAMGMTFPFMMSFWEEQDGDCATSFSWLYLANVLGAAAGSILTAGALIECLGFSRTLSMAGGLNFAMALGAMAMGRLSGRAPMPMPANTAPAPATGGLPLSHSEILWVLFSTGFISMSAEVIWSRSFVPVLSTTVYAFASILSVYLLSTAAGSLAYRIEAKRGEGPHVPILAAALAIAPLLPVLINDPRLQKGAWMHLATLIPFCALLGYLTPRLIDEYSAGRPRRAGWAYAINILGCIAGPLATSYIILPQWGTRVGMIVLTLPFLAFYALQAGKLPVRLRYGTTGLLLILLGTTSLVTCSFEEPNRFDSKAQVRRDYAATVISFGAGMKKKLLVNGLGVTVLVSSAKVMAHLPLGCLRRHPRSGLVICFGMGTTHRSMLSWGIPTTSVELVPSVVDAFPYYFDDAAAVRENPLGKILVDDGRRFLNRTTEIYDVITLDPPPPARAAGVSLLFSREFYESAKRRLADDGILQQWFPGGEMKTLEAAIRSAKEAFPYVRIYRGVGGWGFHILASRQPINEPSAEEFMARLPPLARKDLLEWAGAHNLREVTRSIFSRQISLDHFPMEPGRIDIRDDRPVNEYYFLRRLRARWQGNDLEIS